MNRRVFLQSTAAVAVVASPAAARAPFSLRARPVPLLSPPILTSKGRTLHLSDFAGRVVLLNIWATWCAPCRTEMPSLDRLRGLTGADLAIVPVSIDEGGVDVAQRFFREIGIANLDLYWGEALRVKLAFAAFGLPTSLLIDRQGRELARLSGPAEWDSAASLRQLRDVMTGS